MTRYFVGFLLAVGLIVIVIVMIVRGLISGPQSSAPGKMLDLSSFANTATVVRLTLDTPVAAADTHRDVIMTVGRDSASLQVTKGYDGEIVRQQSYPMNAVSYAVFLQSLALNGFTNGNSASNLKDERGQCALGDRYIYEVIDGNGNDLQRYWYTSCGNGTFKGNVQTIRRLFTRQIPDFFTLTRDVQY